MNTSSTRSTNTQRITVLASACLFALTLAGCSSSSNDDNQVSDEGVSPFATQAAGNPAGASNPTGSTPVNVTPVTPPPVTTPPVTNPPVTNPPVSGASLSPTAIQGIWDSCNSFARIAYSFDGGNFKQIIQIPADCSAVPNFDEPFTQGPFTLGAQVTTDSGLSARKLDLTFFNGLATIYDIVFIDAQGVLYFGEDTEINTGDSDALRTTILNFDSPYVKR